jgi:hypothetical protein
MCGCSGFGGCVGVLYSNRILCIATRDLYSRTSTNTPLVTSKNLRVNNMSNRKITFGISIILIALVCVQVLGVFSASAATTTTQLKVSVGPTSVLADNRGYNVVVVSLIDNKGKPVRALEDTTVRLSSSLINVGTVDSTVTVAKGSTYGQAKFYSTFTPGVTVITAAASGYTTVQAQVTTVGPIPLTLAVYGFPSTLPADNGAYAAVIVQLQDASGSPAKAPIGDLQVTLSCSNTAVGTVDSSVTILGGSTFAVANFQTTLVPGAAAVTAIASGYSSKTTTINTFEAAVNPVNLKVCVATPKIPADGLSYDQVIVQLQNASGKIAAAQTDINVILSSSSTAVGTVVSNLTIPAGKTYAVAPFTTSFRSGSTTIAAVATDCKTDSEAVTTVGPVPTKLAVYCLPASLPADGKSFDAVVVQLQDSNGKPAKDPVDDITVYLFSSAPDAGNVSATLTIPFGETHVAGTFFSTRAANSTTITAQGSGYVPGQGKITTYLIDQFGLNVTASAVPNKVGPKEQATIRGYVSYNESGPVFGAVVTLKCDKTANCSTVKDEGNGNYAFIFYTSNVTKETVYTFTLNASKAGYVGNAAKVNVTVSPNAKVTGSLVLLVADGDGNPLSGVTISGGLTGTTNMSGYANFANITAGSYSVQLSKPEFEVKDETLLFQIGQTSTRTLFLSRPAGSFFSLPVIIGIVVAIVVSVVSVVVVIRKRRGGSSDDDADA